MSYRLSPSLALALALSQGPGLCEASRADVIHVPSQFSTVQAAIDAAKPGDEIILADGVYSGPGNVNVTFGGKAITVRSQNGPAACVIDCQQTARGFIFRNNETAASVLRGVTIFHGQAVPDANLFYPNNGGGVYVYSTSPTIEQCVFSTCNAVYGGGMYINGTFNNSTAAVRDCAFSANSAPGEGSAIYGGDVCSTLENCSFTQNGGPSAVRIATGGMGCVTTTSITNCTFSGNLGTALMTSSSSTIVEQTTFNANAGFGFHSSFGTHTLSDCVFNDHLGRAMQTSFGQVMLTNVEFTNNQGGGLRMHSVGRLVNCSFIENSAPHGGGLWASAVSMGAIGIRDCVFARNTAGPAGTGDGGAVFAEGDVVNFANCRFIENSATGRGGAIYGQFPFIQEHLRLQNCAFIGNTASRGGAIAAFGSPIILANCTLFHNSASVTGGGLHNFGDQALVANSILWMNQPDQIFDDFNGGTTVKFSNIQGGWSGLGESNIALDPLFVNAGGADGLPGTEDDDLRLAPGSPSIDAGFNWLALDDDTDLDGDGVSGELAPLDLARNPRFADDPAAPDAGCGTPVIVDQGAWERTGLSPAFAIRRGDIDANGHVDVDDLVAVILGWGCADPCCLANVNGNGSVDVDDLVLVILNWGG